MIFSAHTFALAESLDEGVVQGTVKKVEDTNDLILRFYEYGCGEVTTSVKLNLPVNIFLTDLMEHPLGETIDDTLNEIHPVKVSLGG